MHTGTTSLSAEIVPTVGWIAAALVLSAYGMMMSGRITADSVVYLAFNAIGSLGLGVTTISAHAWQSATVNVLWLAFGLTPLARAMLGTWRRLAAAHPASGAAHRSRAPHAECVSASQPG